jgi:hypothetical protein
MSFSNAKPSEKFVPSYQLSGKPYAETITAVATAGGTEITFPTITRWIQVANLGTTGQDVKIGFSAHGVDGTANDYFYQLEPAADGTGTTGRLELRCKSLFILSTSGTPTISVFAGLTDIADMKTALTGSAGVG